MPDGSVKESFLGAGGKKNRQKERRLMKGFNISVPPPGASGSGNLAPVSESTASLQMPDETLQETFGSMFTGIYGHGSASKRSPHHVSTSSVPGLTTGSRTRDPRTNSHKRRWGTLIEAAKVSRVSRLIGNYENALIK